MDVKEIREKSVSELNDMLKDLKEDLFKLRFRHAVNQLENPMRLNAVKKDIAKVKTVLKERELSDSAKS
ncbi:MAG: 50S ribosomal protein L29 [Oscillospiraceae bacterium]|nr:50S ribosomal protein L29 [Candidatus Equicaccousia limihippi]